ncbi:MAG: MazG-like family protein [Brachybacterium sp.]|uniref:MazG-like family protein n=1 Tax=unclassified Brachybacterium TaxID=2623841 RepID=UPI003F8E4505
MGDDAELAEVRDELADVLTYCYQLAMRLNLDPDQIVLDKLEKTRVKYPANAPAPERSNGSRTRP